MCAEFEKYMYIRFRDTPFLHKIKVALKPVYSFFFFEEVKMFFLSIEQKYIENKIFRRVVYKLLALNGPK